MKICVRRYRWLIISLLFAFALVLTQTANLAGNEQDISPDEKYLGVVFPLIDRTKNAVRDIFWRARVSLYSYSNRQDNETALRAYVNLLPNPGFEEGHEDSPAYWTRFGNTSWVEDEVFSGDRAVRISASGGSSGITSAFFEVTENSRVEFSAMIKAHSVAHSGGFYRLRFTAGAYASDQITRIRHWDMAALTGETEWRELRGTIIAPPGTHYMTLTAQLTNTSGTFWIDEASASIVQTIPEVDHTQVSLPVIIPAPAYVSAGEGSLQLNKLWIQAPSEDTRFLPALLSYLEETGVNHRIKENQHVPGSYPILVSGDSSLPVLDEHFRRTFPNYGWQNLGQQGYFLSVQQADGRLQVYLGANSEQGRFYGLQTLKQLVDSDGHILLPVDILDYPSLDRRGIMMGLHWYQKQEEAFRRMSELKLNFAWNQGAAFNDKLRFRWRDPFNEIDINNLQTFLALAEQNFIDLYISISPKSPDLVDPPIYSSDSDIEAVVSKLEVLYALGYRGFGLSFDDLSNFGLERLYGKDVERWGNDIGMAHLYFIEQVYSRLKLSHPDIHFMVVTKNYSGIINTSESSKTYLQTLSGLPAEIEIFTALEYVEEMETVANLTGRPHVVMDNFWARFYREQKPELVLPLDRPTQFDKRLMPGYAFLPSLPHIEDESLVSWRTASEYAWAPERYDVDNAFQRAAYRYFKD
jgi:hypothetical protein